MLFRYREPTWYGFGLALGLRNLLNNGTTLGAKKTFGKIFQPVNSYTRFPEYYYFGDSIARFLGQNVTRPAKILDVGSPKLFGLHLAYHDNVTIHLTDVSRLNVDEYVSLWNAVKPRAKGRGLFSLQDARSIAEPDDTFDVVYSMSVIEHIEQDMQDPKALSELLRVLKPGGLLLISVPIGATHVEQFTSDFSYESNRVTDQQPRFFQRIFDRTTARRYIVESLGPYIDDVCLRTIFRRPSAQSYHAVRASIGDSLSGVLGFTNPLWSLLYNRHCDGLDIDFYSSYGPVRSNGDVYGNLVLSCKKRSG